MAFFPRIVFELMTAVHIVDQGWDIQSAGVEETAGDIAYGQHFAAPLVQQASGMAANIAETLDGERRARHRSTKVLQNFFNDEHQSQASGRLSSVRAI